ncbi:MAG: hypothetical protein ACE37E_08775 [Hyphomicrobiales bacterium]
MSKTASAIDEAAFGVVYGSISVMAVLMALHPPVENTGRVGLVLVATVVAVALAKAFAELCQQMLATGQELSPADVKKSWRHSRTVLLAANAPAAAFFLAWLGLYSAQLALILAQVLALALLVYFGGQIGWRVRGTVGGVLAGAAVTGALGLLLSGLKLLAH